MPFRAGLFGLSAISLFRARASAECVSYGVDFHNGGSYFQNASSTDPFTFVSIFEGCQQDVCNNILVDPIGNEYQCSNTSLTPDDTKQLSTCPLDKDQLSTGDWSVLLISNNGNADPIAYERDFHLSVGIPSTVTYTPTVTVLATTTPIANSTTVVYNTVSTTTTKTVTSPSITVKPTVTIHPSPSTVKTTKTMGTVSKTKYTVEPTIITATHTATCSVPARQSHPDPTCTITPTLVKAAALETSAGSKMMRFMDRAVPLDRAQRIAERKARLDQGRKVDKRGLDQATTTITDTNTADYKTTTSTSTAPTSTMVITSVSTKTSTITQTSTTYSGVTVLSAVTVTAPTPTTTKTYYTVVTTTIATKTLTPTITITSTVKPTSLSAVCTAKGGDMV